MPHRQLRSERPASAQLRAIRKLERALADLPPRRARPEDTLRERTEVVVSALADVPCAILVANDRGRYINVNGAAALLTGYSEAELVRMSVWDLTPTPRLALGRRLWREFLRRERMRGDYQIRRKDGELVRARYVARANVLPGVHVSALLITPSRKRRPKTIRFRKRTAA